MKRSKMNLSNTQLLTANMGALVPIGLLEVLPGDTVRHATSVLARCMPMATPPMHRVNLKVHHWFIPHRLVWDGFEDFITGGPDGMDASVFPQINFVAPVAEGSLADYLGVPVGFEGAVSALPFRCYNAVFNEWYRDQDLVDPVLNSQGSGVVDSDASTTSLDLLNVCWEKDYFTTARPWEQKGPDITLPIGEYAPVQYAGGASGTAMRVRDAATAALSGAGTLSSDAGGTLAIGANGMFIDPNGVLVADLSSATGVNVNTVREAFALQRYQEARARYGSRYTEYLAYLGVRAQDARLQRPEYLGGGRQTLSFSEVLQTAGTTADGNGVGQLYGHGIAAMRSNRYTKFIPEHGYIVSLVHVLPETMYPQGLFRTWNRRVKEDFWQRELQHIGQQPVLTKEVYALGANPDSVFGYQDRYDEYRFQQSRVHGEFLSTMSDWHFARLLAAEPVLNGSFVTADPAKRPFQSQDTDTLLLSCRHTIGARRPVAARGTSFIL